MKNKFFYLTLTNVILNLLILNNISFGQNSTSKQLEHMPVELEKEFALSSLPKHLQANAAIYLLDLQKGYYLYRKGSNGFTCFVARTEWEWADFSEDNAAPISFDEEGTKTILPVYFDVAKMRASGKYSAIQVRDTIAKRIRKGIYKAPSRPGISYMLSPIMRTYPGKKVIVNIQGPHYMFYAPYITNASIGGLPNSQHPVLVNPTEQVLGDGKSPYNFIIIPVGEMEKAKIIEEHKYLLERLIAFKAYYKVESREVHH